MTCLAEIDPDSVIPLTDAHDLRRQLVREGGAGPVRVDRGRASRPSTAGPLRRLAEGSYPLRKDFDYTHARPRVPSRYDFKRVEGEGVIRDTGRARPCRGDRAWSFPVQRGRVSPVINLEIRLGYTHRGVEKLSEALPYEQGASFAERISGDNGYSHSLAYCQAVEAAGAQVPERALFLRTVYSEMERLYNHMGDVAGIVLDTAFSPGAQMAYLLRERLLDLNESVSGSRFLRSLNCLGGVRRDIDLPTSLRINAFLGQGEVGLQRLPDEGAGHALLPGPDRDHRGAQPGGGATTDGRRVRSPEPAESTSTSAGTVPTLPTMNCRSTSLCTGKAMSRHASWSSARRSTNRSASSSRRWTRSHQAPISVQMPAVPEMLARFSLVEITPGGAHALGTDRGGMSPSTQGQGRLLHELARLGGGGPR